MRLLDRLVHVCFRLVFTLEAGKERQLALILRLHGGCHGTRSIGIHFELQFLYILIRRVSDHGQTSTLSDFMVRCRVERPGAHREHSLAMRLSRNDLFLDGTAIATAL